jgi:hypothetical protein
LELVLRLLDALFTFLLGEVLVVLYLGKFVLKLFLPFLLPTHDFLTVLLQVLDLFDLQYDRASQLIKFSHLFLLEITDLFFCVLKLLIYPTLVVFESAPVLL